MPKATCNKAEAAFNIVIPEHKLKLSLSAHILQSVKQILASNQDRELLTWSRIKNDERLQGLLETLASWFKLSFETVAMKFSEYVTV